MGFFGAVINGAFTVLKTPFSLFGFSFSFWSVFLWSCFIGLCVWIVYRIWGD